MSDLDRPNPDEILARMKREETASARGKLKIFFGMCPGVGKTYAMLQAARQKQTQGSEVVIGIVETHGRKETEALLEGLPIVPRAKLEYRGTTLTEMDLDAILLWHPGLAVVDELAHTNTPGSRHPKRYQDVLELLDAGIDVFTTLNVQHIESRRDTVQQITGALMRETIPDSILDLADEIVLVDLTPEQLRSRLAEGKVYLGERAAAAAENFFQESHLIALREMALRLVAEHVDRDLRDIMQRQRIAGPWKSGDRLLVAVRGSPFSEKLIRYTRRFAATMEASWIVANIETPRPLSETEQTQLTKYLGLARQLGAEVISTPGQDVGEALLRIAQQHNVTQIVLGKPIETRWARWLGRRSPVDWLIRHSGDIDIHMIRSDETPTRAHRSLDERLARSSLARVRHCARDRRHCDRHLPRHFRLHWLLGGLTFLSARCHTRGDATSPRPDTFSRRAQWAVVGLPLHSATLHVLYRPASRRDDARRLLCHRVRGWKPDIAFARTRANRA